MYSLKKYSNNDKNSRNNLSASKDTSATLNNKTFNSNNLKTINESIINNDRKITVSPINLHLSTSGSVKGTVLPLIKSHDNFKEKISSFEKMHQYTIKLNKRKEKIKKLKAEESKSAKQFQSTVSSFNSNNNDIVYKLFQEFGITPPLTLQLQIELLKKKHEEKYKKKYGKFNAQNKSKSNTKLALTPHTPHTPNTLRNIYKMNEKKINFDEYIQLQSKAEMRLRPKFGDESYNLINYINNIKSIRKDLLTEIYDDIQKLSAEHSEKELKFDLNFIPVDKALIKYKWKNVFTLEEYQNFFLDNIKGKISGISYNQLNKKFKEIKYLSQHSRKKHENFNMKKIDIMDY